MELSRRLMLTGGAAAVASVGLAAHATSDARAAAPTAGKQVAGVYRYKVGSLELTVVTDGVRVVPMADTFVSNANKEQVAEALKTAFMDSANLVTPFNPIVVNTGAKLVLIDTGLGEGVFAQSKGAMGQLLAATWRLPASTPRRSTPWSSPTSMATTSTAWSSADGKPAFPNAEVLVPATELEVLDGRRHHEQGGRHAGRRKLQQRPPRFRALNNKVTQYEAGKDVVPGIATIATPGHTPGHVAH